MAFRTYTVAHEKNLQPQHSATAFHPLCSPCGGRCQPPGRLLHRACGRRGATTDGERFSGWFGARGRLSLPAAQGHRRTHQSGGGILCPGRPPHLLPGGAGRLSILPDLRAALRRLLAATDHSHAGQPGPRADDVQLVFARWHAAPLRLEPPRSGDRQDRGRCQGPGRGRRPHGETPTLPVGLRSPHGSVHLASRRLGPAANHRQPRL